MKYRTPIRPTLVIVLVVSGLVMYGGLLHTYPISPLQNRLGNMMSVSSKQRALAAVLGGFVADAASMGLHWIYDDAKLKALVDAAPQPEFHEPPSCPYYQYVNGAFSPYGAEVFPLLEDVATRGEFDVHHFAQAAYRSAKAYTGRLNHVSRDLVTNVEAGKSYPHLSVDTKDLNGGIKTPILVARYLNDTAKLIATTKEATRVHQNTVEAEDGAVACAILLQQIVLGVTIPDAIASLAKNEHLSEYIRDIVQVVLDDVKNNVFPNAIAAANSYGKACPLPGVLQVSLFVLLTTNGYVDAVRTNIVAGGDNCSRAIIIGACAAAASADLDPVPEEWKQKSDDYTKVKELAEKLIQ